MTVPRLCSSGQRLMRTLLTLTLTLTLITGIGCEPGRDAGEQHLEHFIPPHKPESFARLTAEISERVQLLAESAPDADDPAAQELLDIINWIPELAADSDLRKADWEAAVAIGVRLQSLWSGSFGKAADATDRRSAPERFASALEELVPLAERSQGISGVRADD